MKLFITGFFQVFFVAVNTYFIANSFFFGVFICGVIISLIWSWNVKRIVFGTFRERIIYSLGAGFGSLLGLIVSKMIL